LRSAIAASSAASFADSASPRRLSGSEAAEVRKALTSLIPSRLDSTKDLRIVGVGLETGSVLVVERSFSDFENRPDEREKFVFFIGIMDKSRFRVLYRKQNNEDEQERLLGTIRLKNGREFLVTVLNDPESYSFRVYEYRDGRVKLVYSGGGASC
jgi:hypothetical protein